MIFDKVAKLGVAMAMLGLVILTSCSENDNGMASSYSETQTGKPVIRSGMPIAELDTTYLRKVVNEGHGCGSLAKSAVNVESEGVAEVDSAETEVVQYWAVLKHRYQGCGREGRRCIYDSLELTIHS